MEDEKLAAYYDELTRKGGGAARFKQGLGFTSSSSQNDAVPARASNLPTSSSSSSFLSSFIRASSPSKTSQFDKQAQLQSIQNKLTKKPRPKSSPSRRDSGRSRSPSPSPRRDRHSKRRSSRSRSRSRDRYSRRRRSRSRDRRSRRKCGSRSRSRERNGGRRKGGGSDEEREKRGKGRNSGGGGGRDFGKLIEGYDQMTPAERVKAKMKLQLSRTAEKDETIGKGSGWERFDFDKDAPLDDEEVEAVEDDAVLVKHIGQSFRFSAVEARKEEQIKAAHDEAMFGAPSHAPSVETDDETEAKSQREHKIEDAAPATSLLSDQVLTMQAGSWRDRARKA